MAQFYYPPPTKANIKTSWILFQSTIIATIKFKKKWHGTLVPFAEGFKWLNNILYLVTNM